MSRDAPAVPPGFQLFTESLLVLSEGWEVTSLPEVLKEPRGGILRVSCVRSWTWRSSSGYSMVLWFKLARAGLRPLLLPSHLFLMDNSRLDFMNV